MSEVKLSGQQAKEIMLAINLQLFEKGVISESLYKKAQDRIKKSA